VRKRTHRPMLGSPGCLGARYSRLYAGSQGHPQLAQSLGKAREKTHDDGPGLSLLVAHLEIILYANLMLALGMTDLEVAKAIGSGWRLDWSAVSPPTRRPRKGETRVVPRTDRRHRAASRAHSQPSGAAENRGIDRSSPPLAILGRTNSHPVRAVIPTGRSKGRGISSAALVSC
jgi:hypothetical protein